MSDEKQGPTIDESVTADVLVLPATPDSQEFMVMVVEADSDGPMPLERAAAAMLKILIGGRSSRSDIAVHFANPRNLNAVIEKDKKNLAHFEEIAKLGKGILDLNERTMLSIDTNNLNMLKDLIKRNERLLQLINLCKGGDCSAPLEYLQHFGAVKVGMNFLHEDKEPEEGEKDDGE